MHTKSNMVNRSSTVLAQPYLTCENEPYWFLLIKQECLSSNVRSLIDVHYHIALLDIF